MLVYDLIFFVVSDLMDHGVSKRRRVNTYIIHVCIYIYNAVPQGPGDPILVVDKCIHVRVCCAFNLKTFLCSRPLIVASIIVSIPFTHTQAPSLTWGSCLLSLLLLFPRTPSLSSLSQKAAIRACSSPPKFMVAQKGWRFHSLCFAPFRNWYRLPIHCCTKDLNSLGSCCLCYFTTLFRCYAFENKNWALLNKH